MNESSRGSSMYLFLGHASLMIFIYYYFIIRESSFHNFGCNNVFTEHFIVFCACESIFQAIKIYYDLSSY